MKTLPLVSFCTLFVLLLSQKQTEKVAQDAPSDDFVPVATIDYDLSADGKSTTYKYTAYESGHWVSLESWNKPVRSEADVASLVFQR
ncbi:hypothetical protein ACO2Q8_24960 [Larkinella sp. VNQ87]|uniref:hypothetical protein n=1 Tax=Larkinella sp. VNQ87 TaxID=3400921 RepID=UPI003BFF2644